MRIEDDPDIRGLQQDPGRAAGLSPVKVGTIVLLGGLVLGVYLILPLDRWTAGLWAGFGTSRPPAAPIANGAGPPKDLGNLATQYVPKPPMSVPAVVTPTPPAAPDTSLYDTLRAQYDALSRQYAELENRLKAPVAAVTPRTAPVVTPVDEEAKQRAAEANRKRAARLTSTPILLTRMKPDASGQVHALKSPYSLAPSEIIPCTTAHTVSSETPGAFVAIVSRDVKDTATRTMTVIPKGSKFVLRPRGALIYGDSRMGIEASTLTFPGGNWLRLIKHTLTDQAGTSGLTGEIDRHYARIFGSIVLQGVLRGGTTIATAGYGGGAAEQIGNAVVQQGVSEGSRQVSRQMSRTDPTITVPAGERCQLLLEEELALTRAYPST